MNEVLIPFDFTWNAPYTVENVFIKFNIKVYEVIYIYSIWNLIYAIMDLKCIKVSIRQSIF